MAGEGSIGALVSDPQQAERGRNRGDKPGTPGLRGLFPAAPAVDAEQGPMARSHRAAVSRLSFPAPGRRPPAAGACALDAGRHQRGALWTKLRDRSRRRDPGTPRARKSRDRCAPAEPARAPRAGYARPDPRGAFEGLEGVFQRESGPDRAIVLLSVLGQPASVGVPAGSVVPRYAA